MSHLNLGKNQYGNISIEQIIRITILMNWTAPSCINHSDMQLGQYLLILQRHQLQTLMESLNEIVTVINYAVVLSYSFTQFIKAYNQPPSCRIRPARTQSFLEKTRKYTLVSSLKTIQRQLQQLLISSRFILYIKDKSEQFCFHIQMTVGRQKAQAYTFTDSRDL